jgi:hypothetical protein
MDKNIWVDFFTEELKKELGKIEQKQEINDSSIELYNLYQSFVDAGFSGEQAFELLRIIMQNAL